MDTFGCKYIISTTSEKNGTGNDITLSNVYNTFYSLASVSTIYPHRATNTELLTDRSFTSTIPTPRISIK